jgi:HK97 family phage major capsid protein
MSKDQKAITDAPGYRARWPRNCTGCAQYKHIEGDEFKGACAKFEFEVDAEHVCDAWEERPPEQATNPIPVVVVEPAEAAKSWRASEDAVISFGKEVKALGDGRVGGYGVLFGSADRRDLDDTFFTPTTNFGPGDGAGQATTMNHCLPMSPELKSFAERLLPPVKTRRDELGIFAETVLNLADEYEKLVYDLAAAGKFSWSSGTAQRMIRMGDKGEIKNWPIIEWALTPIPAEPRLGAVSPLKSLAALTVGKPEAQAEAGTGDGAPQSGAVTPTDGATNTGSAHGSGETQAVKSANTTAGNSPHDEEDTMSDEIKELSKLVTGLTGEVKAMKTKLETEPAQDTAGFAGAKDKPSDTKSINHLRFGKLDEDQETVMRQVYDGDYRDLVDKQVRAFKSYVRRGERGLDRDADMILKRQLWDIGAVTDMLKSGMTVAEIKATMVEGIDVLGGYAVPPQTGANIIQRMAGLTVMRGGGALVVQTNSNMMQWLKLTGGSSVYVSGLRGAWGTEIQTPAAKNFTIGLLQIPVDTYTYKVAMSTSLVEDASNIVGILEKQIADTLAVDEDDAFLIGDGANKPRGILPGDANSDSYTEANSGSASTLSWAGLNTLRRAVTSQYRANGRASLIGNSATGAIIESLVDGTSRPYVEELVSGETKVKSAVWRESEAMPDATTNTFPLIYGDLSGYAIIERLGLSIQRYNDSYTGVNVVEFHVRRRIGGHVVESWKFAVQKCSV